MKTIHEAIYEAYNEMITGGKVSLVNEKFDRLSIINERQLKRVIKNSALLDVVNDEDISLDKNAEKILKSSPKGKTELVIKGSSGPEFAQIKIRDDKSGTVYSIDKKYIDTLIDQFFD